MVVMDPLAKPLSCPLRARYAQRDYDKLAEKLQKDFGTAGARGLQRIADEGAEKKREGKRTS